jgi:hypothetical protein
MWVLLLSFCYHDWEDWREGVPQLVRMVLLEKILPFPSVTFLPCEEVIYRFPHRKV